jgi:hypothetical protein
VPRTWTLLIPAPTIKPVTKRKTGKVFTRRPWLNANDRDHWRVLHPIKNDWKANAADQAEIIDLPIGLHKVRIDAYINRATEIRSDAGNFYPTVKAIVDGLTEYGLTEDDSNEYVEGPYLHPGYKSLAPSVLLIVTELSDCHACWGTGETPGLQRPCPECSTPEPQVCPECDGTGKAMIGSGPIDYPCPECRGGE